jgi:hypothetical protein
LIVSLFTVAAVESFGESFGDDAPVKPFERLKQLLHDEMTLRFRDAPLRLTLTIERPGSEYRERVVASYGSHGERRFDIDEWGTTEFLDNGKQAVRTRDNPIRTRSVVHETWSALRTQYHVDGRRSSESVFIVASDGSLESKLLHHDKWMFTNPYGYDLRLLGLAHRGVTWDAKINNFPPVDSQEKIEKQMARAVEVTIDRQTENEIRFSLKIVPPGGGGLRTTIVYQKFDEQFRMISKIVNWAPEDGVPQHYIQTNMFAELPAGSKRRIFPKTAMVTNSKGAEVTGAETYQFELEEWDCEFDNGYFEFSSLEVPEKAPVALYGAPLPPFLKDIATEGDEQNSEPRMLRMVNGKLQAVLPKAN